MICPKCGVNNPNFFIRCVECGAKLPKPDRNAKKKRQLLLYGGLGFLVVIVLAAAAVNLPAINAWAVSLPAFFQGGTVSTVPHISFYAAGETARYGDIQVTVSAAREGGVAFNNQKFYIVPVALRNFQARDPVHFTTSDFILIDPLGNEFHPAGIGDGIAYDLGPGAGGAVELRYIVPKDTGHMRLRIDTGKSSGSVAGSYYEFIL
jgi:hypothetical protein